MIGLVSALRVLGGGLHQYGFTVFFLPVTQDLGLTRASTSLAFSLARAEGSLAAPIVGYLIDRYGPKPMMFTAALLAGIGYILFSWVNSYATFLIVYLGVISLAFTAGFVHAPTVIANSWFIRLRARAMTVVSAAVPVGGALITPLLGIAVHTFGWRWAAFFAGVLFLVAGVPLCIGHKAFAREHRHAPRRLAARTGRWCRCCSDRPAGETPAARYFRARSLPLADFLESHLLDDLPLGRVHHRDDSFHSDDGVERIEPDRSVGISRRLCHRQSADPFSARLDRRLRQQTQARNDLPVSRRRRRAADAVERSLWALWFFTGLYSVLDASIPVFWASVGDFFGRKSFGTIRGNMNLFYTWGAILGPFVAGAIYDRTRKLRAGLHRHHDRAR